MKEGNDVLTFYFLGDFEQMITKSTWCGDDDRDVAGSGIA